MEPLSGTWLELFKGVDVAVMAAIAVISWMLKRATHVNEDQALLIPLGLGLVWGAIEAYSADYAPLVFIAKGVLLNGAGAAVAGRLGETALNKLGITEPTPIAKAQEVVAKQVAAVEDAKKG